MLELLREAQENHQRAAAELSTAQAEHQEAMSLFEVAEAKSAACMLEYTCLIRERAEKMSEFDNFQNYNMLCFTMLRDKMAKKMEPMATCTETLDLASAGA